MRLDRLKQTQFMAFQIGLVTLSFLKLLKVPERGWFQKWFRPFSFCCGRGLLRQRNKKQGTYCGVFRKCNVGEFGAWEMAAG